MGLEDAETLGEGNSSIGLSTSVGMSTVELYLDSTRNLKSETTSWAPIEAHFQTGIREDVDLGVSLWNSSLLSIFRFRNNTSYYDIGMNVNFKYRLTPPMFKRNVAVSVSFIGQLAGYEKGDDYWNYRTFGIAPGIIYSRNVRIVEMPDSRVMHKRLFHVVKSFYAGLKTYFIFTDIKTFTVALPAEIRLTGYPIIYDTYVGISFGYKNFTYLEVHGVFMKNPHDGVTELAPYVGMGTKFLF